MSSERDSGRVRRREDDEEEEERRVRPRREEVADPAEAVRERWEEVADQAWEAARERAEEVADPALEAARERRRRWPNRPPSGLSQEEEARQDRWARWALLDVIRYLAPNERLYSLQFRLANALELLKGSTLQSAGSPRRHPPDNRERHRIPGG